MSRALRLHLLVGMLAVSLSGCALSRTVVWTPDSRSIVFPTDDGGFATYQLDTGCKYVVPLPQNERGWNQRPAVSPDGNAIANVIVEASSEADHIQVIVHAIGGEATFHSQVFSWPRENGLLRSNRPRPVSAYWARHERRDYLLIWYRSGLDEQTYFARYNFPVTASAIGTNDRLDESLTDLADTQPAVDMFQVGMSPVRDDGAGYLAIRRDAQTRPHLFFVTWQGWEFPIAGRHDLRLFERPTLGEVSDTPRSRSLSNPVFEDPTQMSTRLPLTAVRWAAGSLRFGLGRGEVDITTPFISQSSGQAPAGLPPATFNYIINEKLAKDRDGLIDHRVILRVPFGRGGRFAQVRASRFESPPVFFIEILNTHENQTLPIGRAVLEGDGFCPIVRAPAGDSVAVIHADETGRVVTTVIGDDLKVRARFTISGPGWDAGVCFDRPPHVAHRVDSPLRR